MLTKKFVCLIESFLHFQGFCFEIVNLNLRNANQSDLLLGAFRIVQSPYCLSEPLDFFAEF